MTTFEEKVNAYRENKRLIEELEAMNDAVKAEIIDIMHARRKWYRHCKGHLQGRAKRPT